MMPQPVIDRAHNFEGLLFFAVVVNRDGKLKETVSAIASVIEAEKLRVHAQKRTHHILADS